MVSKDYFQGKRIAVIGLGPHGEMVSDVRFLIKAGGLVSIYDLKSEARLKTHLVYLRSVGLANYVCGSIPPDDLVDMDLVILSHEYPRESSFLKGVKERKIPIEYPETLFFKLAPPVVLVGVMGSCGKTTVVSMLEPLLETACQASGEQRLAIIDPESSNGIISNLRRVSSGDIVLMKISNEMLSEMHSMRVSPHIAIFTSIPPKGSYSSSPFEVLSFQTYNNFVIASDSVIDATYKHGFQSKAKMLRTRPNIIPSDWKIAGRGQHDLENASLALETAKLFKVSDTMSEKILSKWKSLKGRLEPVKKVKGVEFFNDTASVSPEATLNALICMTTGVCEIEGVDKKKSVKNKNDKRNDGDGESKPDDLVGIKEKDKNIILIFGGAVSGSDYHQFFTLLPRYVKSIVVIPGSGTIRERATISRLNDIDTYSASSIDDAVRIAFENAKKGDKILFSPGFSAGGSDISRKDRGERFVRAVRGVV